MERFETENVMFGEFIADLKPLIIAKRTLSIASYILLPNPANFSHEDESKLPEKTILTAGLLSSLHVDGSALQKCEVLCLTLAVYIGICYRFRIALIHL